MVATIRTLPHYFPEIFAQRLFLSVLILVAFCAVALLLYKFKKFSKLQRNVALVLSAYIVALLYFTFIGRYSHEEYEYKVYIFYSYRRLLEHFDYQNIKQIVANLAMFVPIGFMFPIIIQAKHRYIITMALCLLLTAFIETMQLLTKCGSFEVDDIINNFIGAVLGIFIYMLLNRITQKRRIKGNHYE